MLPDSVKEDVCSLYVCMYVYGVCSIYSSMYVVCDTYIVYICDVCGMYLYVVLWYVCIVYICDVWYICMFICVWYVYIHACMMCVVYRCICM